MLLLINKKNTLSLLIGLLLSTSLQANQHSVWVGFASEQSDYPSNTQSKIDSNSLSAGLAFSLSDDWALSFNYLDSEGDGNWQVQSLEPIDQINRAENEAKSYGISLNRYFDDYALTLSYSQLDSLEKSLTFQPFIAESIDGDDQVLSFSYEKYLDITDWTIIVAAGAQYNRSQSDMIQIIGALPPIRLDANFESENWSVFSDIDFSYLIESKSFNWQPALKLGWSWEVDSSGDEMITVSREGRTRVVNQISDRLNNNVRTPNTGFWEAAVTVDWKNDWSTIISYSATLSAENAAQNFGLYLSRNF